MLQMTAAWRMLKRRMAEHQDLPRGAAKRRSMARLLADELRWLVERLRRAVRRRR